MPEEISLIESLANWLFSSPADTHPIDYYDENTQSLGRSVTDKPANKKKRQL